MPYRILRDVSCQDVNNEGQLHKAGTVVSDWEVSEKIKSKIDEGTLHYRSIFEPLTEQEAFDHRAKETALEGDRLVEGIRVSPPWDDFVGLHPAEIIERMRKENDRVKVEQVRQYEKGGLARTAIIEYLAPCEREPFYDYDNTPVRKVLEKLEVLSPEAVAEVQAYEFAHRKRPAILTFEKEVQEPETEEVAA